MNPNPWKWILPLALGCAVGLALPRGLVMIFGTSGSALLVSTVTASSILGGFCRAVVGWVMSSRTLSQDVQTLLMCGILPGVDVRKRHGARAPPGRCCMLRSGS